MDASELFTRIRRRLDLEPSEYVADLENGPLCEEAYFELWDILITALGEEAPWERQTFQTVANQDYVDVALDDDVYRVLRVDASLDGSGRWTPIYPGVLASDELGTGGTGWNHSRAIRYYARRAPRATQAARATAGAGLAAWRFVFDPVPASAYTVRLWYIPSPAIAIDEETGEYTSFPDDYPEYVVARVCAQLAVKQESDEKPFLAEAARIEQRIVRRAKPHQLTAPRRMADVRGIERGGDFDDFLVRR